MSSSTVRAALATFLAPSNVAGLNKVYRAQPKLIVGSDYFGNDNTGQGCVGVLHIPREAERLRGVGGGLERSLHYQVDIVLRYRDVSGDGENAQDGFDTLKESLKRRLRSDPTFGTAGSANPIMFGGLGSGVPSSMGSEDLIIEQDLPRQEDQGGGILIWAVCHIMNVVEVSTS